jgi:hypothetical protein
MKNISTIIPILLLIFLASCQSKNTAIINTKFIDSLLANNTLSAKQKAVSQDLDFWKKRLETNPESYINSQQYASMLLAKFQLYGNIEDLKNAEKLILMVNKNQKETESGLFRNLANYSNLQHRFAEANNFSNRALKIGENKYETLLQLFDNTFELGKIEQAKAILYKIKKPNEYAYYFRLSKMNHYLGDLEGSISALETASKLANGNIYLEQAAISNLADLYAHSGEFEKANENYLKSICLDQADYHSITGLGLVALNHDKNPKLAAKIFDYVASKTKSPDIYYRYVQLAQYLNDKKMEEKYALKFIEKASLPVYGNMYNKYLIEIYDATLNDSKKMLEIAKKELINRNTPQTSSWYSWALYKNNLKSEAITNFKTNVSGKPLEGLELFYIAKMLMAEKKEYHANEYFALAYKNRFDLSPNKKIQLENMDNI